MKDSGIEWIGTIPDSWQLDRLQWHLDEIKESILKYKLNNIDLTRLAEEINSVSENKIEEFRRNNKEFMIDKLSYWNYKYNKISKGISKAREVESFIIDLVKK